MIERVPGREFRSDYGDADSWLPRHAQAVVVTLSFGGFHAAHECGSVLRNCGAAFGERIHLTSFLQAQQAIARGPVRTWLMCCCKVARYWRPTGSHRSSCEMPRYHCSACSNTRGCLRLMAFSSLDAAPCGSPYFAATTLRIGYQRQTRLVLSIAWDQANRQSGSGAIDVEEPWAGRPIIAASRSCR